MIDDILPPILMQVEHEDENGVICHTTGWSTDIHLSMVYFPSTFNAEVDVAPFRTKTDRPKLIGKGAVENFRKIQKVLSIMSHPLRGRQVDLVGHHNCRRCMGTGHVFNVRKDATDCFHCKGTGHFGPPGVELPKSELELYLESLR